MGSYVQSSLVKGEQVRHEAQNHWINFVSFRAIFSLFLLPLIDKWSSEYAITNKRVIIKVGLIQRRTIEMNVQKVESIAVDQTILGRILGYGDITVVGTGATREKFPQIADPIAFRRVFQEVQNAEL
jgi:uncharacterized membrane protein YdbT with pleckstrin-like domain